MQTASRYRCPCCGAALVFSSASQQLQCDSCGNSFAPETVEAVAEVQAQQDQGDQMNWAFQDTQGYSGYESGALRAYRCEACGAQIVTDAEIAATSCVYCL